MASPKKADPVTKLISNSYIRKQVQVAGVREKEV
jgi:hypothetical protein